MTTLSLFQDIGTADASIVAVPAASVCSLPNAESRDVIPYIRTSVTSCEAAIAIEPKAGTLRARVLDFLRDRGATGATDQEMQRALNMDPSTQRPRRIELAHAGLIVEADATRQTKSGRNATVWVAL